MRLMMVLPILIFSSCTSCQTSKKKDAALQNADTSVTPDKTDATPKQKPESYDVAVTYLSVQTTPEGFAINLRSELEIFCERLCSEFQLVEDNADGVLTYKATKTPVPGNVQPSRLMEDRTPKIKGTNIKKIIVKNVGRIGNDLVVNDLMAEGKTLVYAVDAILTPSMAIGGESMGYKIAFEGRTLDAMFDDQKLATGSDGKSLTGFVTGYVTTESKVERGDIAVFHVVTLEPGT